MHTRNSKISFKVRQDGYLKHVKHVFSSAKNTQFTPFTQACPFPAHTEKSCNPRHPTFENKSLETDSAMKGEIWQQHWHSSRGSQYEHDYMAVLNNLVAKRFWIFLKFQSRLINNLLAVVFEGGPDSTTALQQVIDTGVRQSQLLCIACFFHSKYCTVQLLCTSFHHQLFLSRVRRRRKDEKTPISCSLRQSTPKSTGQWQQLASAWELH